MQLISTNNVDATGLTLLEVLVALAIISIAITAVIKTVSNNVNTTAYIQKKLLATWVGLEVINKARIGLIKPIHLNEPLPITTSGDQSFAWYLSSEKSANPNILKLFVSVFPTTSDAAEITIDKNTTPLITLEGYEYIPLSNKKEKH